MSHLTTLIKSMAPDNLLKKGFAIVKVNNKIVTDADEVEIGSDISVILSKKRIVSEVKSKSDYDGNEFNV